jgi:hypothetical protein
MAGVYHHPISGNEYFVFEHANGDMKCRREDYTADALVVPEGRVARIESKERTTSILVTGPQIAVYDADKIVFITLKPCWRFHPPQPPQNVSRLSR